MKAMLGEMVCVGGWLGNSGRTGGRRRIAASVALALCGFLLLMGSPAFAQAAVQPHPADGHLRAGQILPVARAVPGRFIVVYRNGELPADVEARVHGAGGRVLKTHDRFGMAVVSGAEADEFHPGGMGAAMADAKTMERLRLDPEVEFVVHDVVVSADRMLRAKPVDDGRIVRNAPAQQRKAASMSPGQPSETLSTNSGADTPNIAVHSPRSISPPRPVQPVGTGSDTGSAPDGGAAAADGYYASTGQDWGVKQVGGYGRGVAGGPAYGPWDMSMGKGVRIAVLDSGVDADHPDISPNLALNMTEVDQTAYSSACDDGSPQDQQGHGTWTASLAAAALGANTGRMVGVAPEAQILNIKVLQRMPTGSIEDMATQCEGGQASGLLSWVIQGIDDAVAQRADVVSLSLGVLVDLYTGEGAGLKSSFDRVTHAASIAGTVVVAAAGNDGFDLANPRYIELPAQARDVLAVVASTNPNCMEDQTPGAVCQDGPVTLAYYSNHGAPLNGVAAPGGSYPEGPEAGLTGYVRGACSNGKPNTGDGLPSDSAHSFGCFGLGHQQYVQAMGTSASAPLAAGVAALLRGAHPEWDAYAIMNAMRSSATRGPGDISTSPFNYGQVNAANALALRWKSY